MALYQYTYIVLKIRSDIHVATQTLWGLTHVPTYLSLHTQKDVLHKARVGSTNVLISQIVIVHYCHTSFWLLMGPAGSKQMIEFTLFKAAVELCSGSTLSTHLNLST